MRDVRAPQLQFASALIAASLAAVPAHAQQSETQRALKDCFTITDESRRLQCLEELTFGDRPTADQPAKPPLAPSIGSSNRVLAGQWRLVRTPNPKTGRDTVSIMHTADFAHSDPNFAGLIIRCSERQPDVLLVFVRPFPPRATPKVIVQGIQYGGTVVPPGAELVLPGAFADAQTRWGSVSQITVSLGDGDDRTKGAVSLEGLDSALAVLNATCATTRG